MRISVRLTEKKLRTLDKTTACGVVRGLYVQVSKLKDGTLAKYFILRDRSVGRVFCLGAYPKMSLSEAFEKAAEWKKKIEQGIDPAEEEKARKKALVRQNEQSAEDVLTFEKLIRAWIAFNESRGRWTNKHKTKDEVWDGFFQNHIPESLRRCPVKDLTAENVCRGPWREVAHHD